jgi:cyclase
MSGFDLDLVRTVCAAVSVPVIAHGGAGRRKDLAGPIQAGASAVAAGSLFVFQGQARGVLINYPPRAQLEALLT